MFEWPWQLSFWTPVLALLFLPAVIMTVLSVPGAGRIEASSPGQCPVILSALTSFTSALETLCARDLGCSWPWMLLRGTTYYQPVSYFSQARAPVFSRALSLNWLKKKKKKLEISSANPQYLLHPSRVLESWWSLPLERLSPVSSLDRAQRRGGGQAGRGEGKDRNLLPHLCCFPGAEAGKDRLD